jgi:hypothetical protein
MVIKQMEDYERARNRKKSTQRAPATQREESTWRVSMLEQKPTAPLFIDICSVPDLAKTSIEIIQIDAMGAVQLAGKSVYIYQPRDMEGCHTLIFETYEGADTFIKALTTHLKANNRIVEL